MGDAYSGLSPDILKSVHKADYIIDLMYKITNNKEIDQNDESVIAIKHILVSDLHMFNDPSDNAYLRS